MRVARWAPKEYNQEFMNVSMDRLEKAANVVATSARGLVHVGKVTRPVYKTGKNAGQPWTARTPGSLKKTIRVVKKHKFDIATKRNIRVYAGNYIVFYAQLHENTVKPPFLETAWKRSLSTIKGIILG